MYKGNSEYVRNATFTVGTSSVTISHPQDRQLIYLRNSGATTITIHFGMGSAEANKGIVLSAGGTYAEANSEGFQTYTGSINAISDGAGGVLSIVER